VTVIDDEVLGTLLHEAASSFDVPEQGAHEILERAFGRPTSADDQHDEGVPDTEIPPDEDIGAAASGARRLRGFFGDHRLLSVAACVAIVAVALGAAWLGISHQPPRAAVNSAHSVNEGRPGSHSQQGTGGYTAGLYKPTTATKAPTGTALHSAPAVAGPAALPASATGSTSSSSASKSSSTPSSPPLPAGEVGQSSKIEQTGSLSLVVAKAALNKTVTDLASLATFFNGFVAKAQTQSDSSTGGTSSAATVTVQVPVDSFTAMLKKAQALGHTSALSTKATDVTGVYVNLQAQITALQASLQQYLTILTKATSVGDILSVQAQINTVQSQIQQLQGQLQVINDETTYSTLTVSVDVKGAPVPVRRHHSTTSGLAKAWHDSVHGFVDAVEGLIRVAGPLLFVLLLVVAVVLGARTGWRHYRRHAL
jgi:hypothetical protein